MNAELPDSSVISAGFAATAEQMVDFANAVGDVLPNIHTDRTRAAELGMPDVVVDGRMLAIVISHQTRQCLAANGRPVRVTGLELRFRRSVHPGQEVRTRIRLDEDAKNRGEIELVTTDGTVAVTGQVTFDSVKGDPT
jgi:acyl dehydratase